MAHVSLESVEAAAHRIRPYVHRTPIVTSKFIDDLVGGGKQVFFKCELFQKTGSFKVCGVQRRLVSPSNRFSQCLRH
jgi:threonine dehydratase